MAKQEYALAFEFEGVFLKDVAAQLTVEQLIYWKHEPEELLKTMQGVTTIFGPQSDPFSIGATETENKLDIYNNTKALKKDHLTRWRAVLRKSYAGTAAVKDKTWRSLLCYALPSEIVKVLGGEDVIAMIGYHYTPQQIISLAERQNSIGKTGPLSFEVHNYFPILDYENKTVFFELAWRPNPKNYTKNQWEHSFPHREGHPPLEKSLWKGARIFI